MKNFKFFSFVLSYSSSLLNIKYNINFIFNYFEILLKDNIMNVLFTERVTRKEM
jgi:hypothetical protein